MALNRANLHLYNIQRQFTEPVLRGKINKQSIFPIYSHWRKGKKRNKMSGTCNSYVLAFHEWTKGIFNVKAMHATAV